MSSTPETATGLSTSGDDSAVPLLANRSSVPAPDDEKLSLSAGLTPKAGVSAALTAPAVIAPGVMAWPIDGAGIRTADRGRQAVALGDLLDQAGIGPGQVFDGNLSRSRSW